MIAITTSRWRCRNHSKGLRSQVGPCYSRILAVAPRTTAWRSAVGLWPAIWCDNLSRRFAAMTATVSAGPQLQRGYLSARSGQESRTREKVEVKSPCRAALVQSRSRSSGTPKTQCALLSKRLNDPFLDVLNGFGDSSGILFVLLPSGTAARIYKSSETNNG